MAEAPEEKQTPLLVIAQDLHEYGLMLKLSPGGSTTLSLKEKLIAQLLEQGMADQYAQLGSLYQWDIDESRLAAMR